MICGSGGYLGEKGSYGSAVPGVGGVYPSNYGCYYTNMDYLAPAMSHSPLNVSIFKICMEYFLTDPGI